MSYVYDPLYPTFKIGNKQFALTIQEDDWTDVILLENSNGVWQSWGGAPEVNGTIVSMVDDAKIMAHGSLADFLLYLLPEAVRRATLRANTIPIPPPGSSRIERLKYALKQCIAVEPGPTLVLSPQRPLPGA